MSLRDALRKAAGLIVELPPEPGSGSSPPDGAPASDLDKIFGQFSENLARKEAGGKTVEQIVREADGPNLDELHLSPGQASAAVTEEGGVDFPSIYAQAGVPPVPFPAEQMLELLSSLPSELPLATKRQTVNVTLSTMGRTMGVTPEAIVADASRKLSTLGSFVQNLTRQTGEDVTRLEEEIRALQAQVEEKKSAIQSAKLKQTRASQACENESDRLEEVLEFFSLEGPPSTNAPAP